MIKRKKESLIFLFAVFISILYLSRFSTNTVHADNTDVMDQAEILSPDTQREIKTINDGELANIKGKPQIAVVTRNSLKGTNYDNIDDYGQALFNKYQFGTKGYDNGVLLIVILHPHEFRMQTGYGVESVLPDIYVDELMNDKVKDLFKKGDYDQGTLLMVQKAARRLVAKQNDLRSKAVVNTHVAQEKQKHQTSMHIMSAVFGIGFISFLGFAIYSIIQSRKIQAAANKFDKEIPEYKDKIQDTQKPNLEYLTAKDKYNVMKKVAAGTAFMSALTAILLLAGQRHEDEISHRMYEDNDDDDGPFGGGGFGSGFSDDDDDFFGGSDFGGGDFGGGGGFSGGGGGDSSW